MTHSPALTLARDALARAKRFIANGRECGYIRMPDADCPDTAHETPGKIDEALAAIDAELAASAAQPGTVQWCEKCGEGVAPGMCRKPGAASADAGKLAEEAKRLVDEYAVAIRTNVAVGGSPATMKCRELAWGAAMDAIDRLAALARPAPAGAIAEWVNPEQGLQALVPLASIPAGTKVYATMATEAVSAQGDEVDAWAELCRRVYVELFFCDQQMTSERRKWKQGPSVRDAMRDAKAALEARDAARAQQGGQ